MLNNLCATLKKHGSGGTEQAHANLARTFLLLHLPVLRQRQRCVPGCLHINQGARRQPVVQGGQGGLPQVGGEGRVEEDDIVGAGIAGQEIQRTLVVHPAPVGAEQLQLGAQGVGRPPVQFHKFHTCRAAGERLESQRPGARKQVQAAGARQPELQPVEQCLAQPVTGGAQALYRGELQPAPAPLTADDTELRQGLRGGFARAISGQVGFLAVWGIERC